jgi:multiple sugar transport system permease protein
LTSNAESSIPAPPPRAPAGARARTRRLGEHRVGWGLIAPFLLLYLFFSVGPTLYGLVMSFFNTSVVRPGLGTFAGLENYREALTSAEFWAAMWHSLYFTVLTTVPLVALPLVLAILTNRIRRGQWFFRLAFFAPTIVLTEPAGCASTRRCICRCVNRRSPR